MASTCKEALEILAYIAKKDLHDSIWWRCDSKYAPITIFINCNDLFYWGSADCEELNIENFSIFKQSITDTKKVDDTLGVLVGCSLFCCRMRNMRPQRPAYPEESPGRFGRTKEQVKGLTALFDACGPERDPKNEG